MYSSQRAADLLLTAIRLHELAADERWLEYCELLLKVWTLLSPEECEAFWESVSPQSITGLRAVEQILDELNPQLLSCYKG